MLGKLTLALVCFCLLAPSVALAEDEPDAALSAVGSAYVGHPVTVYCDSDLPAYGMAAPFEAQIWLHASFCEPLRLLLQGREVDPKGQGQGLITLTHEAIHLKGVFNEAKTECAALQRTDDMARLFGARAGYIPALWHYAYLNHKKLIAIDELYRNRKKCRPNGAWDLSPYDGRWP